MNRWRLGVVTIALFAGIAAQPAAAADGLISFDTVVVGCVAGAAAGALTVVLPVFVAIGGEPAGVLTSAAVASIAAIGCAVGVMSGVAAIGTAVALQEGRTLARDAAEPGGTVPAPPR